MYASWIYNRNRIVKDVFVLNKLQSMTLRALTMKNNCWLPAYKNGVIVYMYVGTELEKIWLFISYHFFALRFLLHQPVTVLL